MRSTHRLGSSVTAQGQNEAIRALVLEDSSSLRKLLAAVLTERGYDVAVAGTGEEALRLHALRPFELMLVDWTLPGISGLEVCREVRRLDEAGDIVIVVATAKNRRDDVKLALEAGASDFVAKPIDLELLHIRLAIAERGVLRARRRPDEQAMLRFTENRFKHMVQNLPGVAFQCELDDSGKLRFSYVSSGIKELLHLTPAQAAADPDRVFRMLRGHDGKGASLFSPFQNASTLLVPNDQSHVLLPDGTRKWIQVMGRPGRQKDGQIVFDGIMIDVTEHRLAQQALRASEDQFRSLIESSPDSILVVRGDRVAYANPRAVQYLGYDAAASVLGRRLQEFLHADDRGKVGVGSLSDEGSQHGSAVELRILRPDGSVVLGEATAELPVVYGGHASLLTVIRDLTERKEMQSRLVLADRMASVGTLAAGVAHEINNPLSYVLSNVRLTREALDVSIDGEILESMRQQLDEAIHGAERMRQIVLDLKTFSQVESRQGEIADVDAVLEAAINVSWNEIRHRAKLVKDLSDVPPVMMNEAKLGQVFLNLLINAAHSMEEGQVDRNVLTVRASTDAAGHAVIEVEDNGQGIPPENLGRIFEPFFTTKAFSGGTGLGLSICRSIVLGAGGTITASSIVGQGTTMCVRLPPGDLGMRRVKTGTSLPTLSSSGPAASVVVVDDELLVGKSIRRALRGHDVRVFTRGVEAVEHLCGGAEVDVVFCDLMMPEMSGMDVFDAVNSARPDIASRFVFMTGGAFTPRSRAFLAETELVCLEKPFELRDIREIVRDRAGLEVG